MAQLEYSYKTPGGVPGLIFDIAPYEINSLIIEEETEGKIKFGMGVVAGEVPGKTIKAVTSNDDVFEGVVVTNVHELDMKGKVVLEKTTACSVMRYGRVWVRVPDEIEIAANDKLYLITSGDDAGKFTNASGKEIPGKFIGAAENGIAPVVLADAAMAAGASGGDTETYTAVTPEGTENPSEEGWYEKNGDEYVLTEDTTVDSEKTYYTKG